MVVDGTFPQWKTCFDRFDDLDSQFVLNCTAGAHGKQLEYEYGAQTDALVPPHQYVPWVLVNGLPLYDVSVLCSFNSRFRLIFDPSNYIFAGLL